MAVAVAVVCLVVFDGGDWEEGGGCRARAHTPMPFSLLFVFTHLSKVVTELPELRQLKNKTHKLPCFEKVVQLEDGRMLETHVDGNLQRSEWRCRCV
jgi:hypothetical protein